MTDPGAAATHDETAAGAPARPGGAGAPRTPGRSPAGPPPTPAERAMAVLDAAGFLVTEQRAGGAVRITESAGATGDLDPAAAHAAALAGAGEGPGPWRSVVADAVGPSTCVVHARTGPHRDPDARTRSMMVVLGRSAADRVRAGRSADAEELLGARRLSELAFSASTWEELVGGITAVVAPALAAAKVGLQLWRDERGYLELLPGSYGATDVVVVSSRVLASELRSLAARAVTTRQVQFSNSVRTEVPLFSGHWEAMGVTRLMCVPITAGGRMVGVLHVANSHAPFTPEDAAGIAPLVPYVAALLDQARSTFSMRDRESLATVVGRAATAVASGHPLGRFGSILEDFCGALRAQMACLAVSDGPPVLVDAGGTDPATLAGFLARADRGGVAMRTGMAAPRAAGDPGWTAVHAPVLISGEAKGTLSLLRSRYEPFVDHEREAVRRLAEVVSLAWVTEEYRREQGEAVRLRERQRIADDLHDHAAQILFSGQLRLEALLDRRDPADAESPELRRVRDILARGQHAIRDVIHQLSRSAPESISDRLVEVVEGVEAEFGIVVDKRIVGDRLLAPGVVDGRAGLDALMSAAREGLVNAAKHAGSTRIWVSMQVSTRGRLVLTVEDGGRGLDEQARRGYGLEAVRRRVAQHGIEFEVGPSAFGGARMRLSMQLPPSAIEPD